MSNLELKSTGIVCDYCDWNDESVTVDKLKHWINAKCPKCGENLLTLEDYENAMAVVAYADIVNKLSPEDLNKLSAALDMDQLYDALKRRGTTGVDLLKENPDGKVIMRVATHNGIKIDSFTKENLKEKE